jgi:DNA-binding XRE family transcriptional regulator
MTAPDDEMAVEEYPLLERVVAAMERRVPTEEDRELLLVLGCALRQLREERGMTPAELACAAGVRREELEAIEAGRPYPGRHRVRHRASKCA